jgi:hypothetical protein
MRNEDASKAKTWGDGEAPLVLAVAGTASRPSPQEWTSIRVKVVLAIEGLEVRVPPVEGVSDNRRATEREGRCLWDRTWFVGQGVQSRTERQRSAFQRRGYFRCVAVVEVQDTHFIGR